MLAELTSLAYVLAPTSTSLEKIHSAVLSTLLSMCFLPRSEGLSPCLQYGGSDTIGKQIERQSTTGANVKRGGESQSLKRLLSSRRGKVGLKRNAMAAT